MKAEQSIERLPLLPLKDVVVFPRMVTPLLIGRPASVAAVEESLASDRPLFLCTQRDASVDNPGKDDLFPVGVASSILQTLRMPDGTMKVVVEGRTRGRVEALRTRGDYAEASVRPIETVPQQDDDVLALMRSALGQFEDYVRVSQRVTPEIVASLRNVTDPGDLADLVCAYLPLPVEERQELLGAERIQARLELITSALMRENELLDLERRVRDRVREQMDRSQREHFLHEQLRAIHQELGGREGAGDEGTELREMIAKAKMPKEVNEKAERELGRYERMPPMSPEGAVIRTYLEWLADMPWQKRTRDSLDIQAARAILDEDHYGLTKVKERILEFLAVRKLSKSTKGPVLCLVGPPGVGKTSLGKSIARAMRRKFVRVSLGGVRDEAEIRGHRRTYIGSMPGRIVQCIKRAKVRNPVFMLDEIDKLSMDYRGDPSSALLEVLDPEQNHEFSDHYLEVEFDLREVFFITTANNEYDIPPPLHDRMEIVRLPGYTAYEKERIAQGFLIPKQLKAAGLTDNTIHFTPAGLDVLIRRYTREAGVRELERQIANLCRKVARRTVERGAADKTGRRKAARGKVARKATRRIVINAKSVVDLLGPEEYTDLRADAKPHVGLAVGLAWTWSGGDILNIETSTMKGKGELTLTGQLGDVMKESAHAAYTYLRAHASELGVPSRFHHTVDLHVHVPEGAIPKDGPSAGIAIAVSMLSGLRNEAPRPDVAMTGEITLRGRILQVGAVKEKVLAAHRAGIRTVIMPRENEKDLSDVPKEVKREMSFAFVDEIDQVFAVAFKRPPRAKRGARAKAKPRPKAKAAALRAKKG